MENRRTKIVCTLGPASERVEILSSMISAGMDVVRLNFSHGTPEDHAELIARVREVADSSQRPIAVLQDLAGPKLRLGEIAGGGVTLETGAEIVLTTRLVAGSADEVGLSASELPAGLPASVSAGDPILLADGALELEVISGGETDIRCRVIVGGWLGSQKGVNLSAGVEWGTGLTAGDTEDLRFGLAQGIDAVALSYVRSEADIAAARAVMQEAGRHVPVIAKIETRASLENIDMIVAAADGIMIARGDLGVETPLERVPLEQKDLIRRANSAAIPAITATQMLRSMVESPRPTRAEVADVANAILDGTDAVMLSEETAIGTHPVEAVAMMDRIAAETERAFPHAVWEERVSSRQECDTPEAVAHAACNLARRIGALCIVSFTRSGATARLVSKYRPELDIIAPTPDEEVGRQLALVWGVEPYLTQQVIEGEELIDCAVQAARQISSVMTGDRLVVTAGVPMGTPGGTNLIRVVTVP